MKTTFIYALCEPGTRTVRYIGKTTNLKKRLDTHLTDSSKKRSHLGCWLRSLTSLGGAPVLTVLHAVAENESWEEEERRYISCARALGMDLVNATDGGEGASGWVPTPETRAAISAAKKGVPKGPHSPEHCSALSAALKGLSKSPAHRAAMSAAKKGVPQGPRSPETRAAIGAALRGRPQSPETRAAQSARQKGVPRGPYRKRALVVSRGGLV